MCKHFRPRSYVTQFGRYGLDLQCLHPKIFKTLLCNSIYDHEGATKMFAVDFHGLELSQALIRRAMSDQGLWYLFLLTATFRRWRYTERFLLFISYKFVKGFLAITFLLLIFSSRNFHDVCQRFLYIQEQNLSLIRQKTKIFPIYPHCKNCPHL